MALPEGLFILGDAACSFNPIYGQGMSVAACGAVTLRQLMDEAVNIHEEVGKRRLALKGVNKASLQPSWSSCSGACFDRPYSWPIGSCNNI